jgi:acyl carrier protein
VELVLKCIRLTFEDVDPSALTPRTKLGEIPDWDSMNAVSLLMHLEKQTGKQLPKRLISPEMTLEELAAQLG